NTSDLIALRLKQIARRESDIGKAIDKLNHERAKSTAAKNARKVPQVPLAPGTLVLVHQTWLDNQHGNKGKLRWAGPYVVRNIVDGRFYTLMELDGTVMKGAFAADRVKQFFQR
ncbi:hypothetical protein K474DRAFT_1566307, partial [Panus rudis PR-1116 ss-1]